MSHVRRYTLVALKIALAAVILGYLLYQAEQNDGFERLVTQPKQWSVLAAAIGCLFASLILSFVRWHMLVGAIGLRFPLVDAMRLGSLGFVLNFVSLGSLGGDLFKAFFIARGQPGKRTEAVATVIVDRLFGLTTMLLIASCGILISNLRATAPASVAMLSNLILAVTAIGIVTIVLLLFVPGLSGPRVVAWFERLPWIGHTAGRLIGAVGVYRCQKRVLVSAGAVSLVVDVLFVVSFYLVARGLPVEAPNLVEHLVVVPTALLAGAIPATPSGLGTMEAAVDVLYRTVPGGAGVAPGDGTLVCLAHRLAMMTVALVGLIYYLSHRAEVREAVHEAEEFEAAELG